MVENTRKKIRGKKEPGKRLKPQQRLFDLLWNSLRKMPRGTQVKRAGLVITVERGYLEGDCPQASKLPLAPCSVCKGPYRRRDCPRRCRPQGSDSQENQDWRCPHTSSHPSNTWGTPGIITVEGQSVDFLLDTRATFCSLKPLVCFPPDPLL